MAGFLDTIFKWLPQLRKPDLTLADAQCDVDGNLKVTVVADPVVTTTWSDPAGGTPLTYRKLVASASKKLHLLIAENTGAADRWIMVFNLATAPPNGSEPVFAFIVKAGQGIVFDLPRGRTFATGIYWGVSSTGNTYTEDNAALFRVSAEVE